MGGVPDLPEFATHHVRPLAGGLDDLPLTAARTCPGEVGRSARGPGLCQDPVEWRHDRIGGPSVPGRRHVPILSLRHARGIIGPLTSRPITRRVSRSQAPGPILTFMAPRSTSDRRLETLHLVRHAHAGDPEAWDGPDELRPLSNKGRRQAERLGSFLLRTDIRPDRLISSPKLRALQTAELVGAIPGPRRRSGRTFVGRLLPGLPGRAAGRCRGTPADDLRP